MISSRDFVTLRYKELNEHDATIFNVSVKTDLKPEEKDVVRADQKVYKISLTKQLSGFYLSKVTETQTLCTMFNYVIINLQFVKARF